MSGTATTVDYLGTSVPASIGSTGQRGFNTNASGTIFVSATGLATGTTPLQ